MGQPGRGGLSVTPYRLGEEGGTEGTRGDSRGTTRDSTVVGVVKAVPNHDCRCEGLTPYSNTNDKTQGRKIQTLLVLTLTPSGQDEAFLTSTANSTNRIAVTPSDGPLLNVYQHCS